MDLLWNVLRTQWNLVWVEGGKKRMIGCVSATASALLKSCTREMILGDVQWRKGWKEKNVFATTAARWETGTVDTFCRLDLCYSRELAVISHPQKISTLKSPAVSEVSVWVSVWGLRYIFKCKIPFFTLVRVFIHLHVYIYICLTLMHVLIYYFCIWIIYLYMSPSVLCELCCSPCNSLRPACHSSSSWLLLSLSPSLYLSLSLPLSLCIICISFSPPTGHKQMTALWSLDLL